jgi:hypothetical protein
MFLHELALYALQVVRDDCCVATEIYVEQRESW